MKREIFMQGVISTVLVVQKLRFTLDVIAGNNSERTASDLICSVGGGRGRRLILAHLQGDSRTDFWICTLSNVMNFLLDQHSKPTHSVSGVVQTGLYHSVVELCGAAVIPFGKRHGHWFVYWDSWRQVVRNFIFWKLVIVVFSRRLPLQALVRDF